MTYHCRGHLSTSPTLTAHSLQPLTFSRVQMFIANIQNTHRKHTKLVTYKSLKKLLALFACGQVLISSEYFSISSVSGRRWCLGCCLVPFPSHAPSGCLETEPPPSSFHSWIDLDPYAWCAPQFCDGASCLTVLCPAELPFSQRSELKILGKKGKKSTGCP